VGEAHPPGEQSGVQQIREQGGESSQKSKAEKSRLGVFAQILSGLRKTGAGGAGEIKPETLAKTSELDGMQSVQKGKNKIGKGLSKAEKAGEIEPELQLQTVGLSDQEKNILFGAGYLAGEFTDENLELTDKGLAADFVVSVGMYDGAETAEAEVVKNKQAGLGAVLGKEFETASAGNGELGEGQKLSNNSAEKSVEKTKNRYETAVKGDTSTEETQIQAGIQQAEAKKTVFGEKEARNRLDEVRNRDKRRGSAVEVRDSLSKSAETVQKDSVVQVKAVTETRTVQGSTREITLELHMPNQGQQNHSAVTSWETKAGQAFEDILARELHQNLNNDIVRHASVVLRDSSEGTIRLALKPESLGNVKIRLEMAENKITGHITVESEEALRAFEREITSLEKAFVESGFEGANLEMSLAGNGGGAEQWQEMGVDESLARLIAASHYEASAAEWAEIPASLDFYYQGTRSVNVLA